MIFQCCTCSPFCVPYRPHPLEWKACCTQFIVPHLPLPFRQRGVCCRLHNRSVKYPFFSVFFSIFAVFYALFNNMRSVVVCFLFSTVLALYSHSAPGCLMFVLSLLIIKGEFWTDKRFLHTVQQALGGLCLLCIIKQGCFLFQFQWRGSSATPWPICQN